MVDCSKIQGSTGSYMRTMMNLRCPLPRRGCVVQLKKKASVVLSRQPRSSWSDCCCSSSRGMEEGWGSRDRMSVVASSSGDDDDEVALAATSLMPESWHGPARKIMAFSWIRSLKVCMEDAGCSCAWRRGDGSDSSGKGALEEHAGSVGFGGSKVSWGVSAYVGICGHGFHNSIY